MSGYFTLLHKGKDVGCLSFVAQVVDESYKSFHGTEE